MKKKKPKILTMKFHGKFSPIATCNDHFKKWLSDWELMQENKKSLPGIKSNQKFVVGTKIKAKKSDWTGTIIKINKKNPSSPYQVKWDKNGKISNENAMSIEVVE